MKNRNKLIYTNFKTKIGFVLFQKKVFCMVSSTVCKNKVKHEGEANNPGTSQKKWEIF